MNRQGLGSTLKRRLAGLAIVAALLLAAVPAIAAAWGDWDGIDPVINLGNGHEMSIYIEWPKEESCAVHDTIRVDVGLPAALKDAKVTLESTGSYQCEGGVHQISTRTELAVREEVLASTAMVTVKVSASDGVAFPIRVHTSIDHVEVVMTEGRSNERVTSRVPLP